MKTFHELTLNDGNITEAGMRAYRMVAEAMGLGARADNIPFLDWDKIEATLRTLEGECPTCYGTKERPCCNCDLKSPGCNGDNCNCTCTNGKIPLYDIWEAGNDR